MSDAFDMSKLQHDEDKYYQEIMGPLKKALWIEQWWGSQGVVEAAPGFEVPAVMLRLKGMQFVGRGDAGITVVVPTDVCGKLGRKLVAYDDVTVDDFKRDGRTVR